jgi:hypothetical protein
MYNFKLSEKTNRINMLGWLNPRFHKVKDSNIPNRIK